MKIAFIVFRFPLLSEKFIVNQITGLIDRGHEVDIYTQNWGDVSKIHLDIEKYQLLDHTYLLQPRISKNLLWRTIKGIVLLSTNFYKDPLLVLRSLNFFKYGKQALSLRLLYRVIPLLNKSYDIVHCQFGTVSDLGIWFRNFTAPQSKLITTFRGYDISYILQEKGDRIYDRLWKTGDLFLANCEFFKQRVVKLGGSPQKTLVHRSGLDCNKFIFTPRYPSPDGKVRIATTGRLVEKKGIEYAIRAVAMQAKIYPNIEYNIIGDGELKADLMQLIQELNIGDIVKLLGWKNEQEIIEILDRSHIFIAPSVTAKDGNQDAPINVLKEAMAMGLPVISTYHGGIPELVEDGLSGFLVPERDADAIADKLNYLIEHPEIWHSMGKAGRTRVEEKYDMNKLNDELVEIYQQLLNSEIPQQHLSAPVAKII